MTQNTELWKIMKMNKRVREELSNTRTDLGNSELSDFIKRSNICIIGIPEEGEKEKMAGNLFEDIIAESFPTQRKETDL